MAVLFLRAKCMQTFLQCLCLYSSVWKAASRSFCRALEVWSTSLILQPGSDNSAMFCLPKIFQSSLVQHEAKCQCDNLAWQPFPRAKLPESPHFTQCPTGFLLPCSSLTPKAWASWGEGAGLQRALSMFIRLPTCSPCQAIYHDEGMQNHNSIDPHGSAFIWETVIWYVCTEGYENSVQAFCVKMSFSLWQMLTFQVLSWYEIRRWDVRIFCWINILNFA